MLGCGAVYGNQWFSTCWPTHFKDYHINFLELFAVVAAVFTWGSAWKHKKILFYTDNLPVTKIWLYRTCVNKDIMRLVRALFLFTSI